MVGIHFRKATPRVVLALIAFFALSYCASHFESLFLNPAVAFLKEQWHLNFKAVFGPKPAVPVNLFTVITVERSLSTLAATWIALLIAKRSWRQARFKLEGAGRLYASGFAYGFGSITFLVLAIWVSGGLIADGLRLSGAERFSYPLRWLVGMLFAGFEEECGARGFSLFVFEEMLGVWPAALISATIFACGHSNNPGENALGLLQVFLFGFFCAINILRTASLWWAAAFHAAWDWTQESFYGAIGSGYWFDAHLFQFRPRGHELISGGTAGPEGSVFVFLILAALIVNEIVRFQKSDPELHSIPSHEPAYKESR
jgi:membrane protease YdiL (CAAX protease family)